MEDLSKEVVPTHTGKRERYFTGVTVGRRRVQSGSEALKKPKPWKREVHRTTSVTVCLILVEKKRKKRKREGKRERKKEREKEKKEKKEMWGRWMMILQSLSLYIKD